MATALVNGIAYSSVNVTPIIPIIGPVVGITKIAYTAKQKKDNNYGLQKRPVSRGYGAEEYEASIEIYKDVWNKIIDASPNKNPLEIPPFPITVVFGGTGVQVRKEVLEMCEFMEDPMSVNAGDTSIKITIPLIIGGVSKF